jgi:hypothetical protein
MEKTRIKFYSTTDLTFGYNLDLAKSFVSNFDFNIALLNISDVIECYSVLKCLEANPDFLEKSTYCVKLKKSIGVSLNKLAATELSDLYKAVEFEYYSEFWELFSSYKLYTVYTDDVFSKFLFNIKPDIVHILYNNKLCKVFENSLKDYFLSDHNNANILLGMYELLPMSPQKCIYLPESITNNDKDDLLVKYIESDQANLNYLQLIVSIINRDEIRIKDTTRLLAKKKIEKLTNIFFENNTGQKMGAAVEFNSQQQESVTYHQEEGISHLSYSLSWIKSNSDNATLLNNFIYLFEYVDDQMRITLTSKQSDIGAIENAFTTRSKNNYPSGWVFEQKDLISNLQLYSYNNVLQTLNISIEDLISWFFSDYIKEQFHVDKYIVSLPSKDVTAFEKCRTLIPEIESTLKKFNQLVDIGYIDQDLLEISSNPITFSDCKSFFPRKYIYPNSNDFNRICFYFFSDQCMLNYLVDENKSFKSFFEMLVNRDVYISNIQEYNKPDINWLVSINLLYIESNQIIIKDPLKLFIIRDLYRYETINYINCSVFEKKKIDELIDNGFLASESSLFSRDEQHYFNYNLNKKEFGNSLDLRNKYVHGTQPVNYENDNKHQFNYLIVLKLLILIIIKINDELCNKNLTTAST